MNHKNWITRIGIAVVLLATVCCIDTTPTPTQPKSQPLPKVGEIDPIQPKPQPSGPSYAMVESNPPGAQVEVGMKSSGGVVQYGSGRMVGSTPVKVELKASDVVMTGSNGNIYFRLIKTGYFESVHILGLGTGGKLEPGKTYSVFVTLKPLK
jgi:hypothetical protein